MPRLYWRSSSMILGLMLTLVTALFSLSLAQPVSVTAQDAPAQPTITPTPNDPAWLAFSIARAAIEEQKKVRLPVVRKWDFFQDDWGLPNQAHPNKITGIDSCVSTVNSVLARKDIFGWTIVITSLNNVTYEARVSFDLKAVAVCDIQSVAAAPTAAPAANGTPNANLPAPVAGSAATGSFELGGHVDGLTPAAINALRTSGAKWIKKQLPMAAGLEKGKEFIASAKSNGFKILIGLVGDKAQLGSNRDGYISQFAQFAGQLAAAGADAIEVWNEPNIDREWPAGQINGGSYVGLLAPTFNAIKTANPNTLVISGAPAPTGFFGSAGCGSGGCNDDVFMQQMATAGAAQYLDCVGLHYNEGVLSPSASSGDPRGSYPTYFFGSMTNRGKASFSSKPVCYTELGYLSGEGMGSPIPGGFNWTPNDPVTVAEQAAWLAEAATIAARRGDVRIMIVWNINFTRWDSDPMGGYAIIRPDGSCPACNTLGSVMKK